MHLETHHICTEDCLVVRGYLTKPMAHVTRVTVFRDWWLWVDLRHRC